MINRKDFLKSVAFAGVSQALVRPGDLLASTASGKEVVVANSDFRLTLVEHGKLHGHLVHVPSGITLADGDYSYSFGDPAFTSITQAGPSVTLRGVTSSGIAVVHEFKAGPGWIEEKITATNQSSHPVSAPFRCGFVLPVTPDTLKSYTFTAVPYRREPRGDKNQYADYSLEDILSRRRTSRLREDPPRSQSVWPRQYEDYASEGWAFTDGRHGFLVTKYNQSAREYAILDRVPLDGDRIGLRWGGAGVSHGDPEGYLHLEPGKTHSFGVTRLTAFQGNANQGFYTFRSEMESRGHGVPENFDPPVHWNELYDNKLWWLGEPAYLEAPNREKYYRLEGMKEEAAKARAIGCEALYLDPGWDTPQSSKIWDVGRLGALPDFVKLLRNEYGLKLSLHTPLTNWVDSHCDIIPGTLRKDSHGQIIPFSPCGASRQYVEETARRLHVLAEAGVGFFMFDGTWFNGPCWDPTHGHSVPSTVSEHVDATNRLASLVHEKYPKVLIEMHDQVVGGADIRYVPTYYGHAAGGPDKLGFDSVWAFEMMWDPMQNLLSGNSIVLYYYNLAYSLPLYIHIDLRKDNPQALMFWWNASTCRHLGFGGTPADAATREAHASAMKTYRRLKPFFAAGSFYGIEELVHLHRHPAKNAAVVNCFNLEERDVEKEFTLDPLTCGLKAGRYNFSAGSSSRSGEGYKISVPIPARGHSLIEIT